ncbi:MAG TPA: Fe-S cluster assembly protein SufD [bacterium]|nr:Fe-S cluster assembly protein SufD [bacterium]
MVSLIAEPPWLATIREKARDRYSHLDWPTPQEEEWRRTDLSDIAFDSYAADINGLLKNSRTTDAPEIDLESTAGFIRFRNNTLQSLVLKPQWKKKGIRLLSLHEGVQSPSPEIGPPLKVLLERSGQTIDNRILAWHHSVWDYGVYLYVPPFVEVPDPFVFDFTMLGEKHLSVPRVLVHLEQGARAVVIQKLWEPKQSEVLCNSGVHLMVREAAALDFVSVQDLGFRSLFFSHGEASVQRDGQLNTFEALFGARLSKTRLDCSLEGPGGDVRLNGLFFARGKQHMDIRSIQRHRAPQTNSRAFYKGAVKDSARTIYQGLIEVSPEAAKTDAYLTNRNLILNSGARADSIPSLKIDTNDVRCSHGSTTGRLNPEEVFYLMSRGLDRPEAERLLIGGFFEESLQLVPTAAAETIRRLVQERLKSQADHG